MKRRIIFPVILFLCIGAFTALAQPKQLLLTGSIKMATGEKFPYKLVLTESEGRVNGYSLTYQAPDETKTTVTGILDRQNHTLTFKEKEIISSHPAHTKAFMCLVDASLEYVQGGNGNILTGSVTSKETDRTSCTGGVVTFSNDEEIQNLFGYQEQYDTVITMKKKTKETYKPSPVKSNLPEQPLVTDKITYGIEKSYDWHSDTVVIDVWDGGNVDGDRITLSFNGKPYLTKYFLVKDKRQLRLPLAPGINTIAIFADNEGSDPPNTANLLLTDGATQYATLAYNPKGQQAVIKIKRVR